MFTGCLAPDTASLANHLSPPSYVSVDAQEILQSMVSGGAVTEDVAFQNLEGEGAQEIAERWAENAKIRRKLDAMKQYLRGTERALVQHVLEGGEDSVWSSRSVEALSGKFRPQNPDKSHEPSERSKSRSGFNGRATSEETAKAMARVVHHVPPIFRQPESDEETEDEDMEFERARTAHHLFADQAGISIEENHFLSFFQKDTSPVTTSPSRMKPVYQETLSRRPEGHHSGSLLTPTSMRGSQSNAMNIASSPPLASSPGRPRPPRCRDDVLRESLLGPPPPMSPNERLASPVLLSVPQNNPPSALKGNKLHVSTSHAVPECQAFPSSHPVPAVSSASMTRSSGHSTSVREMAKEDSTPPFLDLRNLRSRQAVKHTNESVDEGTNRGNKRRRMNEPRENITVLHNDANSTAQSTRHEHSDDTNGSDKLPSSRLPQHPATKGLASSVTVRILDPSLSSDVSRTRVRLPIRQQAYPESVDKQTRQALKLERQRIVEKISLARPDLVTPELAAKLERRQSRVMREKQRQERIASRQHSYSNVTGAPDVSADAGLSRFRGTAASVTDSLPSQDDEYGSDVQASRERSRKLAEAFKQEFAKGRRPGVVVPRLSCLESQEEQPP